MGIANGPALHWPNLVLCFFLTYKNMLKSDVHESITHFGIAIKCGEPFKSQTIIPESIYVTPRFSLSGLNFELRVACNKEYKVHSTK